MIALFDTLKDKYYHIGFDNLYNSAMFCRTAFMHPMKLLVHGVTQKGGRGIPGCVAQQELTNRTAIEQVRGTVKAAKLEGDDDCPCLFASSVYDTKPVHYLSMVTDTIKWIVKERSVYNVDTKRVELMQFLWLNQIDTYNYGMGNVDIADQLRGFYRVDIWLHNRKWWCAILFWAFGVCITNAYILYIKVCDEECVP